MHGLAPDPLFSLLLQPEFQGGARGLAYLALVEDHGRVVALPPEPVRNRFGVHVLADAVGAGAVRFGEHRVRLFAQPRPAEGVLDGAGVAAVKHG